MNAINASIDRDTLITFGNELTTSSGIRAVSAWRALCQPDATFTLDDDDAPYEFRGAVGGDIGWDTAWEDLDPHDDIPRYLDYLDLHAAFGPEWPVIALFKYLEFVKGVEDVHAEITALTIWRLASERYEEWRKLMPQEAADELEEEAA